MLTIEPHPLLDLRAFITEFESSLENLATPTNVLRLFSTQAEAEAPLQTGGEVRVAVRDLLRHGGFKPTGPQQTGFGVPYQSGVKRHAWFDQLGGGYL